MMLVHYASKKAMKECIGKPLAYSETSFHGPEYKRDGWITVAGRPAYSKTVKREFFANVRMADGLIAEVK